MIITIFSTATCPYCGKLKDYLSSKNLKFTEKLIDGSQDAQEEMENISGGFLGVPFTSITFDDGRKETVIGFDKGKLDSLLS